MEVLLPLVTAAIIDKGIEAGDMGQIYFYGIIMLVMAFLSLAFGALAGKYAAEASSGFACNLREAMYENIQTFSFSNIDKFSTAGLVTRMTTDVTNMQNAYQTVSYTHLDVYKRQPQDHSTKMILRPFSSGAAIRSIACPAAFSLIPSNILIPSDFRQLQQPVQIPVIFYGMGRAPCQQRLPVLHGLHADHSGSSRPAGRLDSRLGILKHHAFLRPDPQKPVSYTHLDVYKRQGSPCDDHVHGLIP